MVVPVRTPVNGTGRFINADEGQYLRAGDTGFVVSKTKYATIGETVRRFPLSPAWLLWQSGLEVFGACGVGGLLRFPPRACRLPDLLGPGAEHISTVSGHQIR